MVSKELVRELVGDYSADGFVRILKQACAPASFVSVKKEYSFKEVGDAKVGLLGVVKDLPGENGLTAPLLVADVPLATTLTERSSRIRQFKLAKKVLEHFAATPPMELDGVLAQGIFVFHDANGNFRVSLVTATPEKGKFNWSKARRQSFYVTADPDANATFVQRMCMDWSSLKGIKDAFSVEKLTKEFYNQLFAWYERACDDRRVEYPNGLDTDADNREDKNRKHLIRLITRLMFVWFLKQKKLVPDSLFDEAELKRILKDFNPVGRKQHQYYRAILQNLFFATLNSEIDERGFATAPTARKTDGKPMTPHHGVKTKYRYADEFAISRKEVLDLFRPIPFLNGGLFECLDLENADGKVMYYDGFSQQERHRDLGTLTWAHVPNDLFFDPDYGIIPLLKRYNFTVEENSPGDEDVALDPELLGKVFENLLGAFNPETQEIARNATGSFYTPREIVNYMVDESLIAHLATATGNDLTAKNAKSAKTDEAVVRALVVDGVRPSDEALCKRLVEAIETAKILDPACGSGAFPRGALLKMVELLRILKKLPEDANLYDLKLKLIENCIFGSDIQEIAVQISKLRIFISLVCEQKPDMTKPNYGINTLPNLETKFVAANSLIALKREPQGELFYEMGEVKETKDALWDVRHKHFLAKTRREKNELRKQDKALREKLAAAAKRTGYSEESTRLMASWDPYNQNVHAEFFDPEWMFNVKDGFDIVIGNPPYKIITKNNTPGEYLSYLLTVYKTIQKSQSKNLYVPFIEAAITWLVKTRGVLNYIVPEGLFATRSYKECSQLIQESGCLRQVVYFTDFVFENAITGNLIFLLQKGITGETIELRFDAEYNLCKKDMAPESFLDKLMDGAEYLSTVAESFKGMVVKDRSSMLHEKQTANTPDVFLLGKDIKRWIIEGKSFTNFNKLTIIGGTKRKEKHAHVPRILIRRTGDSLICSWLDTPALTESTLYSIWSKDERCENRFLLGILNSRLLDFYCKHRCITNQQGYPQILLSNLLDMPIRVLPKNRQAPIISLVDRILAVKKRNPAADTSALEREIDEKVYRLYGLTDDEIRVIEGKDKEGEGGDVNGQDARCPSGGGVNGRDARCPSGGGVNGRDARCPSGVTKKRKPKIVEEF